MEDQTKFAPGSRVLVRGEEWLVKSTLSTNTGGNAIRCLGLSELVRNHEALFLTDLDRIEELRPEETILCRDDSAQYRRTRLYLETLLRRTPATDEKIYLGHTGAMNPARYQLQPAHMALSALRPRILIADGVGLGKTIEVGVLLSELIKRGRGDRILVVAIRSMLTQFQQEIWARFAIPLVRLDSVGLQRVRSKIPANKNPFYYYDRAIISIDTLKNDAQYRHYLEQCRWDVIVIDECHNVANAGSQRNRLAGLLSRTCDSLILTSATPHNGRPESFANLMNMLEPTAIADVQDYTASEIKGLFARRFKKDVEDEVGEHFRERTVELVRLPAGRAEEAFFAGLASADLHSLQRGRINDELYRIGLLKGFLSSPAACVESIDGRLKRIERRIEQVRNGEAPADLDEAGAELLEPAAAQGVLFEQESEQAALAALEKDRSELARLRTLAAAVDVGSFRKYQHLLALLAKLGVDGSRRSERVIIFSERLATLAFLHDHLTADLGAGEGAIVQFHAGLSDIDQQQIVESFGKEDSRIRILLASDVASEGVNLHYYCHLMVHFDIPWSLITLEQRNGRIDRFGQHQTPMIHYLLTTSEDEAIKGDLRVLERLIEKEQEAHKNIGDAATLLGLHDAGKEEEHIARGLASGAAVDAILPDAPQDAPWWLELMAEIDQEAEAIDVEGATQSLFASDFAFVQTALNELYDARLLETLPQYHPDHPDLFLLAPEDLRRRCDFMPQEAVPANWTFHLSTDRARVMQAIADAQREDRTWPQVQLLWELHPAMEWLQDRLLVRFNRHEAPVVITRAMQPQEHFLLFQGIISNKRGQPVIAEWFGLLHDGEYEWAVYSLEEVLGFTGFGGVVPSTGQESTQLAKMRAGLPDAVTKARKHMTALRDARSKHERRRLQEDVRKLREWLKATEARLQPQIEAATGAPRARLQHELNEARKVHQQRQQWLAESYQTDENAYIRLAAVFTGA